MRKSWLGSGEIQLVSRETKERLNSCQPVRCDLNLIEGHEGRSNAGVHFRGRSSYIAEGVGLQNKTEPRMVQQTTSVVCSAERAVR